MKRILAAFTTFALVMSLSLTSVGKVAAVTTGGGGRDDAASGRQEAPVVPDWHVNPATGHSYAQIVDLTFDLAEADALALGGHLVTINDRAEQDWLSATFTQSNLLIGLTDRATEGHLDLGER